MPIDDNPVDALKHRFEMEDLSTSPVAEQLLKLASYLPLGPFSEPIGWLKNLIAAQSGERNRLLLETIESEIPKHAKELERTNSALAEHVERTISKVLLDLLLDAVRKSENTRAEERVRRIALILFNAVAEPKAADADEVEEMMRVAMELSDRDILQLKELLRIQGHFLEGRNHIPRFDAHSLWTNGYWGDKVIPELDSVFNKLESYGLVTRIHPPNNINIMADYQRRYVLLPKGVRFVALTKSRAATE